MSAHPELPVVRLLRHRVLEDDHRPDGRLGLDVRDVEALDPDRQALEVERLAQLLERLDAAQPALLRLEQVRLESEPCVLVGETLEAPLLAPLGSAHLDARSAPVGQEALERGRVAGVGRHDQLRRDARRRAVVLEGERLQDRGRVAPVHVLEVKGVPVDELAVAEREDLHGREVARDRDPDHVDGADRALVGRLALGEVPDREQSVPVPGRVLEALGRSGLLHALLEVAQDRQRLSGQELDHPLDHLAVLLLRDVADARGLAALDVVVEARDARVAARLRPLARPVLEDAVEHVEGSTHLLRVRVRPEVDDTAAVPLPREHHPRVLVLDRDRDVGERLVVPQADVERRPVALDEVLLDVERLDLGARDDHLDVLDQADEPAHLRAPVAASLEVRAHTRAQRLRLSDVQHAAVLVAEQVDARLRWQRAQLGLNSLFHYNLRLSWPCARASRRGRSSSCSPRPSRRPRGRASDGRRCRGGRRQAGIPLRLQGKARPAAAGRPRRSPRDVDLEPRRLGAQPGRGRNPARPHRGGEARRHEGFRLGLQRGEQDDAPERRRADELRLVRSGARPPGARSRQLHHRQRAQPEPLLVAAVQPGRERRGRPGLPLAARPDVHGPEGRQPRHPRLRRGDLTAGHRPARYRPRHALADGVHPGPRHRLSRERPDRSRSWTGSRSIRTRRTPASPRPSPTPTRRRSASPTTGSWSACSARPSTEPGSRAPRCRSSTPSTASRARSRRRRRRSTRARSRRRSSRYPSRRRRPTTSRRSRSPSASRTWRES